MLLWMCCALIGLWMTLRDIPGRYDARRPLPELIALIPLLWIPTTVVLIVAVSTAAWPQSIVAAALLCAQLLWHSAMYVKLPKALLRIYDLPDHLESPGIATVPPQSSSAAVPDDGAGIEEQRPTLKLMTLNCRFGRADAQSIVQLVRNEGIDVLALQEVTPHLLHSLESCGIRAELPFTVTGEAQVDDNGGSNALMLRSKPSTSSGSAIDIPAAATPTATLTIGGRQLRFASTHPKSPGRGGLFWHRGIESLGALDSAAGLPKMETVILGDLNSSLYHPVFRTLLRTSAFVDASYQLHSGYHRTFPSSWRYVPPLIEIDHVLITPGLRPVSLSTSAIPGSDHRAVIASIRLL